MQQHYSHRPLNRQDYKTLALSALGGALEFYDFVIYMFFSAEISALFFPQNSPEWVRLTQTFGIFAAGYLARPVGGIIMAHFGDLFGRKRMFSFSILLMAVPTLCIGLLPTYDTPVIGFFAPFLLLIMRILQGAAVGGEIPGAWVFVSEHVPQKRIGLACGTLTAGLTAGILLGSLVATSLRGVISAEDMLSYGWRIPFFIGGVFGLCAMFLRRWLEETPVFMEMKQTQKLAEKAPIKEVIHDYRPAIILSMMLTWVLSAGIVVVIIMFPTYLNKSFNIPMIQALNANSVAIIALVIGCIFFGMMMDKFGIVKTLFSGCLLAVISVLVLYHSLFSNNYQLILTSYAVAGFSIGVIGAFPYVMVHAFPSRVLFSGISFSFNMAYAIAGGLTPTIIPVITQYVSKIASGYYVAILFLVGAIVALYLRKGTITRWHSS